MGVSWTYLVYTEKTQQPAKSYSHGMIGVGMQQKEMSASRSSYNSKNYPRFVPINNETPIP